MGWWGSHRCTHARTQRSRLLKQRRSQLRRMCRRLVIALSPETTRERQTTVEFIDRPTCQSHRPQHDTKPRDRDETTKTGPIVVLAVGLMVIVSLVVVVAVVVATAAESESEE